MSYLNFLDKINPGTKVLLNFYELSIASYKGNIGSRKVLMRSQSIQIRKLISDLNFSGEIIPKTMF